MYTQSYLLEHIDHRHPAFQALDQNSGPPPACKLAALVKQMVCRDSILHLDTSVPSWLLKISLGWITCTYMIEVHLLWSFRINSSKLSLKHASNNLSDTS